MELRERILDRPGISGHLHTLGRICLGSICFGIIGLGRSNLGRICGNRSLCLLPVADLASGSAVARPEYLVGALANLGYLGLRSIGFVGGCFGTLLCGVVRFDQGLRFFSGISLASHFPAPVKFLPHGADQPWSLAHFATAPGSGCCGWVRGRHAKSSVVT